MIVDKDILIRLDKNRPMIVLRVLIIHGNMLPNLFRSFLVIKSFYSTESLNFSFKKIATSLQFASSIKKKIEAGISE